MNLPFVLVDTSVWIEHLNRGTPELAYAMELGRVRLHSAVFGELACGALPNRAVLLWALGKLPRAVEPEPADVRAFVESNRLFGKGLGWADAQILRSSALAAYRLLSRDKSLCREAARIAGAADCLRSKCYRDAVRCGHES